MLKITTAQGALQPMNPQQVAKKIQEFQGFLRTMQQNHENLAQPTDRSNKAKQTAQANADQAMAFEQAYTQLNSLVQTVHPRQGYEKWNPQANQVPVGSAPAPAPAPDSIGI